MPMPLILKATDVADLQKKYYYLVNYEGNDPNAPIDPLSYVDSNGDSLLHIAAGAGDLKTVQLLLAAGVCVDLMGDMDNTALHYAKRYGHNEVAKFLIDHDADTTLENLFGESALSLQP